MARTSKAPQERHRELVDCAVRLFTEKGYGATAVSDIVREVGVAQGTFYYHFKSKEAVLEAVVDRTTGGLTQKIMAAVEREDSDASKRLDRVLSLLMAAMLENKALIAILHHPDNEVLHERMRAKLVGSIQPAINRLVTDGVEAGTFNVPHAEEASELLLSTVAHLTRLGIASRGRRPLARLKATVKLAARRMLGAQDQ